MPFEYCDENGKCCWCHKGKPEYQAWDWMVCRRCIDEMEEELLLEQLAKQGRNRRYRVELMKRNHIHKVKAVKR